MLPSKKTIEVERVVEFIDSHRFNELVTEELTIYAAAAYIAKAVTKVEWRTFINGNELQATDYFWLNYQPNINQNAAEFWFTVITKMIYKGKVLVVEHGGQWHIADSFTEGDETLTDKTFTDISVGTQKLNRSYRMREVFYFKMQDKNITNLLKNVSNGYNILLSEAVESYKKAGGERGILNIDAMEVAKAATALNKSADEILNDLTQKRFKVYFENKNAVLPLYKGYTYDKKTASDTEAAAGYLTNIDKIDEKIVSKVALAFNMPVGLLKGDITETKEITSNFVNFCVTPYASLIAKEVTSKLYGKENFIEGCCVNADYSRVTLISVFDIATSIDKLIASGTFCIDDILRKTGNPTLGTEWSKKHYITKNYQDIENLEDLEGGEKKNEK